MAERRLLTDRYLRSLRPAPPGQRDEVFDTRVPGFGIRVTDLVDPDPARRGKAGKITFVLFARFSMGAAPTRRVIGTYGAIKLEEARRIAGEWRSQIDKGIDPQVVEAERREAEARERALRIKHSFANVAQDFIAKKLAHERRGKQSERDLRSTFIAAWADQPISEITRDDVLAIINAAKERGSPGMARTLLVLIKRFFGWVVDTPDRGERDEHKKPIDYGLKASPCDRLSIKKIIGDLPPRTRRLTDAEVFAFWRATGRMKYPVGSAYRMLLLTGLRLNEAAKLAWSEVHGNDIIVPASRMKGKEGKAREHLVPLSTTGREIIGGLPRFKGKPFLFSLNASKRPLVITNEIKRDLDRRMLRTLKALARHRGEDHEAVTLPHWLHAGPCPC